MEMKRYEVISIGNALLDITANVDEGLLSELGIRKGGMMLISSEQQMKILSKIEKLNPFFSSGGSAANTAIGVSALGGKSAFIGRIGSDAYGKEYLEGLKKRGVDPYLTMDEDVPTGTAITLITPDGERSFATYLGAASRLRPEDIPLNAIAESRYVHVEGYLLDVPDIKRAIFSIVAGCKEKGVKLSIDLSDTGVVKRHRNDLKKALSGVADVVFSNEDESEEYTKACPEEAARTIGKGCSVAVVKIGEKGSIIFSEGAIYNIAAFKVKAVNSNGAGDAYAAGLLHSLAHGFPIEKAGKVAAYIAGQSVASPEATVQRSLVDGIKKILED